MSHMPRMHPEDLAEFSRSVAEELKAELRNLHSRAEVSKDLMTLSVSEVARILDKNKQTITRYFKKGIIPAQKVGGSWVTTQKQLNQYLDGIKE